MTTCFSNKDTLCDHAEVYRHNTPGRNEESPRIWAAQKKTAGPTASVSSRRKKAEAVQVGEEG